MDDAVQLKFVLAEEITPNPDATQWTIRVRKGVTFHNGRDLTADDVIFSSLREVNPKHPMPGAAGLVAVDVPGMKKLDTYTVQVPCHVLFATFAEMIAQVGYGKIVPDGSNPGAPVGTGAFEYRSFTPGQQSVFVRNEHYWRSGLAYLSELVFDDVSDQTAQINGPLSGQFDVVNLLSVAATRSVTDGGGKLLAAGGGGWTPFAMRVDQPPFNDVRVRQAMRYIVNRPEMMDAVFGGKGILGNGLFSMWDPSYDHALPQREQDIARAKSLLKSAGRDDLAVTLVTTPIAQRTTSAAQVFARQGSAAGVEVRLDEVNETEPYGPNYLKWTFAQDYLYYALYLPKVSNGYASVLAVQRIPLRRCALQQLVPRGAEDRRPFEAHRYCARDAIDRLRPGRLHHPRFSPDDRRLACQRAWTGSVESRGFARQLRLIGGLKTMTIEGQADADGHADPDGEAEAGADRTASDVSRWRVGFIGTGQLGSKIVGRLVGSGVGVAVHDTSEEAAASSLAAGATWAPSPAAASSGADVVMTCLPRPDVVEAVVGGPGGVLENLRRGGCWIDITTNDVAVLHALSARAGELGVSTLEAPVTGGVHKAALGELTVLVGGDEAVFADHLPLLQRIGSRVIYLGVLGQASRMKVITNMLAFIHLVAVGEALTLAASSGIDLKDAFDAIRFSSGNSFVHETESQVILSGSYDIGFTVDLALKDLGFAMGMASELGVPVRLAPLVEGLFRQAKQRYGGGAWSPRVVQLLEDEVGVSLRADGFPASLLDGDVTAPGSNTARSVATS